MKWFFFRLEAQQSQYRYSQPPMIGNGNSNSNSNEYVTSQYQQNGNNGNYQHIPSPLTSSHLSTEAPKEILSVSGKKKCSYCSEELGKNRFELTHTHKRSRHIMTESIFRWLISCLFFSLFYRRAWSGHDHRELATVLPFGLFQMLCVPYTVGRWCQRCRCACPQPETSL